MSDERVRLFVALELPAEVREALTRWRDRLPVDPDRSLRPVAPEALHVTLCFLGWRRADEIPGIAAACGVVAAEPAPALSLGSPLWLPRRRPRVLAVELGDPARRLGAVQSALSGALSAGGWYQPEHRPYLPHVTVARVKAGRSAFRRDAPRAPERGAGRPLERGAGRPLERGAGRPPEPPAPPRLDFHASCVVLYRSRLSPSGARYEALTGVELAGPNTA